MKHYDALERVVFTVALEFMRKIDWGPSNQPTMLPIEGLSQL